jgi:hypothetical protein
MGAGESGTGAGCIHQRTRILSLRQRGGRSRRGERHVRPIVESCVGGAVVRTEPLLYCLLIACWSQLV